MSWTGIYLLSRIGVAQRKHFPFDSPQVVETVDVCTILGTPNQIVSKSVTGRLWLEYCWTRVSPWTGKLRAIIYVYVSEFWLNRGNAALCYNLVRKVHVKDFRLLRGSWGNLLRLAKARQPPTEKPCGKVYSPNTLSLPLPLKATTTTEPGHL